MKVALLGAGHIAGALVAGWTRPEVPAGQRPQLFIYDPFSDRAATLAHGTTGRACGTTTEAVTAADLVVLAMRPDDVEAAARSIADSLGQRPLVSVAAYVTVERLVAGLEGGAFVGRVMPSVAVAVGRGTLLLVEGTLGAAVADVRALFGSLGRLLSVDESLYDEATAVSACGPGFGGYFIEALADAGRRAGLDRALAIELAAGALAGAAELVERGDDPGALWRGVAVPGGMTAATIESFAAAGLPETIAAGVAAAVERAHERRLRPR
jgi:pyrroline-5-carboxylate reductase